MQADPQRVRTTAIFLGIIATAMAAFVVQPACAADPVITEFSEGLAPGFQPRQITAARDGNVWFTTWSARGFADSYPPRSALGRVTRAGTVTEFPVPATFIDAIVGGPDGNLWYSAISSIGRMSPSGALIGYTSVSNRDAQIQDMTLGPDGNVWFTLTEYAGDQHDGAWIGKLTPSGSVTRYRTGLSPTEYPGRIVTGGDGNLWFIENPDPNLPMPPEGTKIGRITPNGVITEFAGRPGQFLGATQIAPGPDGHIWFASSVYHIGRINTSGQEVPFASSPPYPYDTTLITDMTAGADGNMWFTEASPTATTGIGRVTQDGAITRFGAGLSRDRGIGLGSITAGSDGNLWFTEYYCQTPEPHCGAPYNGRIGKAQITDTPPPPPPPSPPPTGSSCPDVQVVAVRGSRGSPTDPSPLDLPIVPERATDPTIAKFIVRLMNRLGENRSVDTAWIRYDAAWAVRGGASYSFIDWGRTFSYNRSVDGGVAELEARLPDYQAGCVRSAGTKVVLVGYSQGAQIVGRALDQGMPLTGVKAVVLLGDPTFSVDHSGDVTYQPTFGGNPIGALGARSVDFPRGLKVFSICRPRDAVCDLLGGVYVSIPLDPFASPELFPEHTRYRDPYTVGSGPWWSYTERTFPPPTNQMADKVAHQALMPLTRASNAMPPARSSRAPNVSAAATVDSPVVVLPQHLSARPGEAVVISAALSYDPEGGSLRFDWDLDGDGTFERSTTQPWIDISFATAQTTTMAVRAVGDTGAQATATAALDISPDAPGRPSAPIAPAATAGDHSVRLTWSPPSDDGGLPIVAYVVRDAATGASIARVDGATSITLDAREPGQSVAYTITALNEAWVGATSIPTRVVVPLDGEPPGDPTQPPPPISSPSPSTPAETPGLPAAPARRSASCTVPRTSRTIHAKLTGKARAVGVAKPATLPIKQIGTKRYTVYAVKLTRDCITIARGTVKGRTLKLAVVRTGSKLITKAGKKAKTGRYPRLSGKYILQSNGGTAKLTPVVVIFS